MTIRSVIRTVLIFPLLILAIPISAALGIFGIGKYRDIAPGELAAFLRRLAEDDIADGEWDKFECVPLKDPRLETIRRKAFPFCGRPGPVDQEALLRLASEAASLPVAASTIEVGFPLARE